jgi:hypothetical protein
MACSNIFDLPQIAEAIGPRTVADWVKATLA